MLRVLKAVVRHLAMERGKYESLYRRICRPGPFEYAEFLRRHGGLYSMGEFCAVNFNATIEDRAYVRLGSNVRLTNCTIVGHDGSVNMINRAYGLKLDHVGKVDIRDNVYVGLGAIVLPGVTIGPNAIVSAGSVVSSDVKEGDVVAGVPARAAGRLEMSIAILKAKNRKYPWAKLIEQRVGDYDPEMEPVLVRMRVEYFYGARH